jgi:hypothetical protein
LLQGRDGRRGGIDLWRARSAGLGFEKIVSHIGRGDLLDVLEHPNSDRYPGQRVLIVRLGNCVYLVPFSETDDEVLLRTIIPSRKATRDYLGEE